MIYEYFKSLRKYVPSVPYQSKYSKSGTPLVLGCVPTTHTPPQVTDLSVSERNRAAHLKISNDEFQRRDRLVKQASLACTFQVGDTCFPVNKAAYEKYGPCMIQFVARKYLDMGPDDSWPNHDNPMILTFSPLNERTKRVNCTVNFLSKSNIHLVVELPQC